MKILIKNGRVIDPANNIDSCLDVLVDGGKIAQVGADIKSDAKDTIDAKGKIVMPGVVDMHVHLREPGREDKETVESGSQAALRGGVTSVLAMPNTTPAMDSPEHIQLLKKIIQKSGRTHVFVAGAITLGRQGEAAVDVGALKKEGVVAITDDGTSVESEAVMLEAMRRAAKENVLVVAHCEEKDRVQQGVMNSGFMSTILGLRGISAESEYRRVAREIELAKKSGARLHIAHISSRRSVQLVAEAKKKGISVSAEVTPHHVSLTEEELAEYDTNLKMSPPLRTQDDRQALVGGLADGTIDCIASDHAPHTEYEKEIEFDRAEFGVIGLETALSVAITELADKNILTWLQLVHKMCLNPAKILGIPKGTLSPGADADIAIVDPLSAWKVTKESFVSKSKNSAFLGRTLKGVVEYTICAGKIAYKL